MHRPAVLFLSAVCLSLWSTGLLSRPPDPAKVTTHSKTQIAGSLTSATLPDTFILAQFSFDDGVGGPDPEGWVSVDQTVQEPYFHVDDFVGLGGPYAPLEGARSLWCGRETFVGCASCPGYGDSWWQSFESVAFPSSGDVTVAFKVEYDCEPLYDYAYIQYLSKSDVWQTLDTFNGKGAELASVVVPSDSTNGSVRLRFHFESDGSFSDEDGLYSSDGAVVIDSVTVSDTTGVLDFQDFEAEVPGALTTVDGDWTATVYPPFGNYVGLFDGATVLQEDTLVVNTTYLWGFFNGSTEDYSCGGHPEQPAVPYTQNPGSTDGVDYLNNEIRSPFIDLTQDENGTPITSELGGLVLEFDVYRDLPLDNLVFYTSQVRYLVDGVPTPWTNSSFFHSPSNDVKDWHRAVEDFTYSYLAGATHIQIAIGCVDGCQFWCGSLGTGSCHSHAPLIDNVRLVRTVVEPLVVTNTNDSGPGSLREAVIIATDQGGNDPDRDAIHFNIPGPGPHVITLLTDLPASIRPVVIDATTQPGYSGTPLIVIDGGGTSAGRRGPQINGNSSVVRGLEIRNFTFEGLRISGTDYSVIESNYIHHNGYIGILIFSTATKNMIGGVTADLGNTITDHADQGISLVGSGADNTFLSNSIARNGGLGIDLMPTFSNIGVTPNDPQDPDTGPNGLQNFPTTRWASSATSTIGAALNSTPNSAFLVQFFSSPACDGSGYGEGETYLGTTEVTTDANGDVDFVLTTTTPFGDGEYISATATDEEGATSEFSACFLVSPATAIGEDTITRAALYPAVPNPFNPTTVIRYDVPEGGGKVTLRVYDVAGRLVQTLVDGAESAGEKRVTWDGHNKQGSRVASGVYFYRMTAPGFTKTRKMVLLQ